MNWKNFVLFMMLFIIMLFGTSKTTYAEEYSFNYCYDCWKNPNYPLKGKTCHLYNIANPLALNGTSMDSFEGNWKLSYIGLYKDQNNVSSFLQAVATEIKDSYNLDTTNNIPIYKLTNENNYITYGFLLAYADDNSKVIFIGDTQRGAASYLLSPNPITNSFDASITKDISELLLIKKSQTVTPPTAISNLIYTGAPLTLISDAVVIDGNTAVGSISYSLNNSSWSTSLPQGTDAGSYSVYYKVAGNDSYNEYIGPEPVSVTIAPAGIPILTAQPIGASGLEANGKQQALLETAGAANGGTVMYSVNGGAWSDAVPQASEAGEYKISYYIKGDSTHTDSGSPEKPLGTLSVVIAEEPMEVDVKFVFITGNGHRGVPFDVKNIKINPSIIIKDGKRTVSQSGSVTLEVSAGEKEKSVTTTFSKKLKDLAPGRYTIFVSGLPKTVNVRDHGKAPSKYKLSVKAEINEQNGKTMITVYLIFKDQSAPEEPVVYALPEDEIGAYALNHDGTKMYLLFHTYDICMAWLGRDDLCSGYERCFHKDGK